MIRSSRLGASLRDIESSLMNRETKENAATEKLRVKIAVLTLEKDEIEVLAEILKEALTEQEAELHDNKDAQISDARAMRDTLSQQLCEIQALMTAEPVLEARCDAKASNAASSDCPFSFLTSRLAAVERIGTI